MNIDFLILSPNDLDIFEGKATSRLHRKSSNKYNKNSCWTAGVTSLSLVIPQTLPRTGFLVSFYYFAIPLFLPRCLKMLWIKNTVYYLDFSSAFLERPKSNCSSCLGSIQLTTRKELFFRLVFLPYNWLLV